MVGYIMSARREYYTRLDPFSRYTEQKFVQRYRLSKAVVRILIKRFVATQRQKLTRGKQTVSHRLRFCIALRYFATGASFMTIGDCHGVSKSTVCRAVKEVSSFFHNHLSDYVHWPDSDTEKANKAYQFYKEKKKPLCFGLVDGTHVPIACPQGLTKDENQYYCYKGYYSINVMIVCDWDNVIFHVDASNPGSSNDIYVMNGSDIKHLGERNDFKGYYLLGDSGYVLTDYVLTPVKVETSMAEVRYNKWHRTTRSKVERTIGILKQRWRCLDTSGGYLFHAPERAGEIVEACVCLHNCARVGQVKLLRDFHSRDGFRRIRKPVVQPDNVGLRPAKKFANMRKEFIDAQFSHPEPVVRAVRA